MRYLRILPLVLLAACDAKQPQWFVCYEWGRDGLNCDTFNPHATRAEAVDDAAVQQAKFRTFRYFVACEDRMPEESAPPTPEPTPLPDDVRYSHAIIDANSMPECPLPERDPWWRRFLLWFYSEAGAQEDVPAKAPPGMPRETKVGLFLLLSVVWGIGIVGVGEIGVRWATRNGLRSGVFVTLILSFALAIALTLTCATIVRAQETCPQGVTACRQNARR